MDSLLDAQRAAIKSYCESVGLHLLQIHEDVESGGGCELYETHFADGTKELVVECADSCAVNARRARDSLITC